MTNTVDPGARIAELEAQLAASENHIGRLNKESQKHRLKLRSTEGELESAKSRLGAYEAALIDPSTGNPLSPEEVGARITWAGGESDTSGNDAPGEGESPAPAAPPPSVDGPLFRAIAQARALDPDRAAEVLRGLGAAAGPDGELLLDGEPASAADLEKILPPELLAPRGFPGSGGRAPRPLESAPRNDIVERGLRDQKFFVEHEKDIVAELKRRENAGGGR